MPVINPAQTYSALLDCHRKHLTLLQRQYSRLSWLRLVVALAVIAVVFQFTRDDDQYGWFMAAVAGVVVFVLVVKRHGAVGAEKRKTGILVSINEQELSFLAGTAKPSGAGGQFLDRHHAYAADLDLFGAHSLYQYLNRTATVAGSEALAAALLEPTPEVVPTQARQRAVQELAPMVSWRQDFQATAQLTGEDQAFSQHLSDWLDYRQTHINKVWQLLSYLLPVVFGIFVIIRVATGDATWNNWIGAAFLLNLLLSSRLARRFRGEKIAVEKAGAAVERYRDLLEKIGVAEFRCDELLRMQRRLSVPAAAVLALSQLAQCFKRVENIQNVFGNLLLNGAALYHVHTLRQLEQWRQRYASGLRDWLRVVAEMEVLHCLANFSYNHPDFIFPELDSEKPFYFDEVGHPLIPAGQRIGNCIDFSHRRFVILTGSNMAGKSTFLRTIGISRVLAGMGAPVAARAANVHLLPIWMSMSPRDSLAESESYFMAEVKRLRRLVDDLEKGRCLVLLDEILRGTNSADKRNGTLGIISKMIDYGAVGVLATHDLEVCRITDRYPRVLTNKCFEVQLRNDELVFDYRLKPGVCHHQSATFLMQQMKIIEPSGQDSASMRTP